MEKVLNTQFSSEQFDALSRQEKDYLLLQAIDSEWCVGAILNRMGAPNVTVCPRCHVDDFTHVEGCAFIAIEPEEEV